MLLGGQGLYLVEERASSPGAGWRAVPWQAVGLQSTSLKMFVDSFKLATLFAEGELGVTSNSSVVWRNLLLSLIDENSDVLTLVTGITWARVTWKGWPLVTGVTGECWMQAVETGWTTAGFQTEGDFCLGWWIHKYICFFHNSVDLIQNPLT